MPQEDFQRLRLKQRILADMYRLSIRRTPRIFFDIYFLLVETVRQQRIQKNSLMEIYHEKTLLSCTNREGFPSLANCTAAYLITEIAKVSDHIIA